MSKKKNNKKAPWNRLLALLPTFHPNPRMGNLTRPRAAAENSDAINEARYPSIPIIILRDVSKEAEELAREWNEQANRGETVNINSWEESSAVIAALEILVRVCKDGTCRTVEKLFIHGLYDESAATSLRNLFHNCPNLCEVDIGAAKVGYRVFMEAINEGMCPSVKILTLWIDSDDVAPLVRAIENGKLKSLETMDFGFSAVHEKSVVDAIVSALTTGQCSNFEEVLVNCKCDASVAEKFVGAIAEQRFPRLRAVSPWLFDPEEISDRNNWEAAKALLVRNLSNCWIQESKRGKKGILIDGEANPSSVIASALEIFARACQDGTCSGLERLLVACVNNESAASSLSNIFQNCPNLREVHLSSTNVAFRVFLEAVNEGMCPKLEHLKFGTIDDSDVASLARAIENGSLKNLRKLNMGEQVEMLAGIPNVIVLALTDGECPNLESVKIDPECNEYIGEELVCASTAKKFVRAIADEKFPKLKEVNERLMGLRNYLAVLQVPEEFADRDNETILSYLREGWEYGTESLSVVKVVITGPREGRVSGGF